jgi:hypothetical protein
VAPVKKPVTKPPTPAKPKPILGWSVLFLVTIKGHGISKDINGFSEFEWTIDRSYDGTITFNQGLPVTEPGWSREERMEAYDIQRKTKWLSVDNMKFPQIITATEHDKQRTVVKDKGEGDTYENTTVTTQLDVNSPVLASAMLAIDNKLNTYDFAIGLICKGSTHGCQRKISTTTSIERTDHGYGNLPTSQTKIEDTTISFIEIIIPAIEGLVKENLFRTDDLKLVNVNGHYEFSSPKLQPDKPMITNVPESKSKVEIQIVYVFNKL